MSWKKIRAIIRREYVERVRTKAFWIGTLLLPVFFVGYILIQVATSGRATGERRIAVIDLTGHLFGPLQKELSVSASKAPTTQNAGIHWTLESIPVAGDLPAAQERLRQRVLEKKIDGYLILSPDVLEKESVEYYSAKVSELLTLNQLERSINHVILADRLANRGLPAELSNELERRVDVKAFKVLERGTEEEKGAGFVAVLIFTIIMYSTFIMYGFQNLRGVIEEKTNRIVEIIIASVRPTELMLGKIIGIGLVGLTQYFVWSIVAMNLSLPGLTSVLATSAMGAPKIPISLLVYFIVYFIVGYFLYASIYTAVGAPFNTDQEAQQLAMIPMMFLVSTWAFFPSILNNPNGGVATFVSLFPFTAPLAMFMRISLSQPPTWQIAASMVSVLLTTVATAWLAGRIYRVGILMYGKKPTIPEIARWVRYRSSQARPGTVNS